MHLFALNRRACLFGLWGLALTNKDSRALGAEEIETSGVQSITESGINSNLAPSSPPRGPDTLLINGVSISKEMVFRFLPIMLPMTTIRVTSLYGLRRNPIRGGVHNHHGVDFAAPSGTPVFATAAGRVIFVGWRGDYGLMVEVQHGLGFSTIYGHLSRAQVQPGAVVDRHALVGNVGTTGAVTGPHLHYEIRHNDRPLNPVEFILRMHEAYRHLPRT